MKCTRLEVREGYRFVRRPRVRRIVPVVQFGGNRQPCHRHGRPDWFYHHLM